MSFIDTLRAIGLAPIVLDDPATVHEQLKQLEGTMEPPVIQGDSYEPDYAGKCMNCGQSPVVTVMLKGECIYTVGLCGPCTWGEAAMVDPEKWNE